MNEHQKTAAIIAIKETYPDIDWNRFEDIDSALNGNLWYGPDYNEFLKDNPLEYYEWKGYEQAQKDIEEILEPLPWVMWFDLDGGCVVTDKDPNDDDSYWATNCRYCGEMLHNEYIEGKLTLVDDSDGDVCSGNDELENENQPHESDEDYYWIGGEWEQINPRKVLMFDETFKQVF